MVDWDVVIDDDRSARSSKYLTLRRLREKVDCGQMTVDEAIALYPKWMNQSIYSVFALHYTPSDSPVWLTGSDRSPLRRACYAPRYYAVKMKKRGNDIHRAGLRRRFKALSDLCRACRDITLINGRTGVSRILFITLTYNPHLKSKSDAYVAIGKELNLFRSDLISKFGRIQLLRCFETGSNGYPHVHAIILFTEHQFPVFQYRNQKGQLRYRLSNDDLNVIRGYWPAGFIMVEGANPAVP